MVCRDVEPLVIRSNKLAEGGWKQTRKQTKNPNAVSVFKNYAAQPQLSKKGKEIINIL